MIDYATILDAARLHFRHVACSPTSTRAARHKALELEREVAAQLDALNDRCVTGASPAWDAEPDPLRSAA